MRGVEAHYAGDVMADGPANPASTEAALRSFLPVPIDSLDATTLTLALYIRHAANDVPTLYRSAGVAFDPEDSARLRDQGVKYLYIATADHTKYRQALTERLDRTFNDPEVARAERSRVIRAACTGMIDDVLLFPGRREMIDAVSDISKNFALWSASNPEEFTYLLDMSGHDWYTATHMVNVGVGCGLLARAIKPGDDAFFTMVVLGGLLHDLGKRNVPEAILNKEGKLAAEEWDVLRKHPLAGYEELRVHKDLAQPILLMARDHHERIDGKGYPRGAKGDDLSLEARLCAVVDVFDALASARPYRGPTPAADALRIMTEGRGSHFDNQLLDAWVTFVEEAATKDPSRVLPASPDGPTIILAEMFPAAGGQASPSERAAAANDPANRRRHHRFNCDLTAQATFVQQGKPGPVPVGQAFDVRVLDLSRTGARLGTSFPLSRNDVLSVDFRAKDGVVIRRQVTVVRVRSSGGGAWEAGVAFGGESASAAA